MVVLKLRRRTTMGQVDEVNALIGEVGGRHGNAAHRAAHLSPTADGADGGRGVPPAACLAGLNNMFRGGRRSSSRMVRLLSALAAADDRYRPSGGSSPRLAALQKTQQTMPRSRS